jgi:tripartite-type tricarboxylate transporter receptor subunit TctC
MSAVMRLAARAAAAVLALAAVPGGVHAQTWPAKPVRLVITFPPGGPVDFVARSLGDEMAKIWGQSVLVDNRPGGGGIIGTEIARAAPPDGYTLLLGTHSGMVTAPLLNASIKYHPIRDFTAISQVVNSPLYLVAHPSVPARDVAELVALLRAQPGKLNYGSVGQGSATHLAFELFAFMTKTEALHVPYKGTAPMLVDLLAGTVQLSFSSIPTLLPHVRAGKLRALGNGSLKRAAILPDVPTLAETVPGLETVVWYGLFGPARMPASLVRNIHATATQALRLPALHARFVDHGLEPIGSSPEEFAAFVKQEHARWDKLIRLTGVKLAD